MEQALLFEASILCDSISIGLERVSDPSEIKSLRKMLAEVDQLLVRALESTGEARGLEPEGPTGDDGEAS